MADIYIISDTHFGHEAMLHFTTDEGIPVRDFDSVFHMDETMVYRWNRVVKPQDHVYHLGDVTMKWRNLAILDRLNGHKRLLPGNHDIFPTKKYLPYFEEIKGTRLFQDTINGVRYGWLLSHYPVREEQLKPNWINVHGHIHERPNIGPKYFNVSVEAINYTPISLTEIKNRTL